MTGLPEREGFGNPDRRCPTRGKVLRMSSGKWRECT